VEKPATFAVQAHATSDQGFGVSQEECTLNSDNSGDQVEEMLFNTDDLKRAGIGLYGWDVYLSIPKSQEIYGDFAEIPETRIESEDTTQPFGGESFVTQLQLQYGAEEIGQQQTTKFYDTNNDANGQHSPTVSTTTYCEDITGANQPSSTTKLPGVSSVSRRARTAYTSSQLREIEQEPRNNNYLCRPHHISLATLLNLSERQVKMSFRNWKKRRKKNQNDEEVIRISGSEITSISRQLFISRRGLSLNHGPSKCGMLASSV
jgi:hypothetical protein